MHRIGLTIDFNFEDRNKYRELDPLYTRRYLVTKKGEVIRDNMFIAFSLDIAKNGTVSLQLREGGYSHPSIRELVAHYFIGKKPKGYKLVSIDGDIKNAKLSNLAYMPTIARKVYKKRKRYCGQVIYKGVQCHIGVFYTKEAADEKVDRIIHSLKEYNRWEDIPFNGDVKSLAYSPFEW